MLSGLVMFGSVLKYHYRSAVAFGIGNERNTPPPNLSPSMGEGKFSGFNGLPPPPPGFAEARGGAGMGWRWFA